MDIIKQIEIEEEYLKDIELNILNGIINPRLLRWFNENPINGKPLENPEEVKERYLICKNCKSSKLNEENYDMKKCMLCGCHIPTMVQLEYKCCPAGKW